MKATGLLLLMVLLGASTAAAQTEERAPNDVRRWSEDSALTLRRGRVESGLFRLTRWGVRDEVELAARPLLELAWPHLEAKLRWLHGHGWTLSSWHRISYPTRTLRLVSREGALGLLPARTDVPVALAFDSSMRVSFVHGPGLVTLELGFAFAPHLRGGDQIVLDFPFLYSRFASFSTPGATFAGLSGRFALGAHFAVAADARLTTVGVVRHGYALEQGLSLAWTPSARFLLSVGYRVAHGRYPVGVRTHWLPTLDLGFAFGG